MFLKFITPKAYQITDLFVKNLHLFCSLTNKSNGCIMRGRMSLTTACSILRNLRDDMCPPGSEKIRKLLAELRKNNPFADKVAKEMETSRGSIIKDLEEALSSSI